MKRRDTFGDDLSLKVAHDRLESTLAEARALRAEIAESTALRDREAVEERLVGKHVVGPRRRT
jgi:hypothetical protein